MALIFDPDGDLIDIVGRIGDVLSWAEFDGAGGTELLTDATSAVGELVGELRRADGERPVLIAPDGTELDVVHHLPSANRLIPPILDATDALPAVDLQRRAPGASSTLRQLDRCRAGGTDEACLLAGWSGRLATRWVLDDEGHRAYVRLRDRRLYDVFDHPAAG